MAVVIGGAAIGLYELALLAAAAITATFLVSPQGQEAAREAARITSEALKRTRDRPKKAPDPDPVPKPPISITLCPKDEKEPQREKCPVCGTGFNPTPGRRPAYLGPPPRAPTDDETIPPLNVYTRTKKIVKQARVWERLDGTYIHRDTFHKGMAAELETYDRRGRHTGSICPQCGSWRKPPNPDYYIDP